MDNEIRLIDANALKEFINNGRVCDICPDKKLNCAIHCDFPDTLTPLWEKVIDNAPTVDTTCPNCDSGYAQGYSDGYLKGKEERPQGEWVFDSNFTDFGNPYGTYKCSECGGHSSNKYSFCKDCGADMMKEVENE